MVLAVATPGAKLKLAIPRIAYFEPKEVILGDILLTFVKLEKFNSAFLPVGSTNPFTALDQPARQSNLLQIYINEVCLFLKFRGAYINEGLMQKARKFHNIAIRGSNRRFR